MAPKTATMAELWTHWQKRAQRGAYPFQFAAYDDVECAMAKILPAFESDREASTREFSAVAAPHRERAMALEAKGDKPAARESYLKAFGLYRMARFPTLFTEGKREAYRQSQDCLIRAHALGAVPIRRVEMPFKGRPGEGDKMIGYLRLPPGKKRAPVLVGWAGVDSFKEDFLGATDPLLERGAATLTIDMPGTGDSPIYGSEDGERQWTAVFEWIAKQPELDASHVCAWGGSFGGYWATKVAHTHREYLAGMVSQGGGAHLVFQHDWVAKSQERAGLPWGISEMRGNSFGRPSYDGWYEFAPKLSLLDQGVLDKPCAPLLCINGVKDVLTPIEDYYIVLQHGSAKTARFYPGGHMGASLDGVDEPKPLIVAWLSEKLGL
jgi:hypothetical protein